MPNKWLLLNFIFLLLFSKAFGQSDYLMHAREAKLGTPQWSISPDHYEMKAQVFEQMSTAKAGGELGLFKWEGNRLNIGITVGGYLEIKDFVNQEVIVYGMWRGNFGLLSFWEYQPLNEFLGKGQRITASLGAVHESRHANAESSFDHEFGIKREMLGRIPSLSSIMEHNYLPASLNYKYVINADYELHVMGSYRYYYYSPSAFNKDQPLFENGISLEASFIRSLSNNVSIYIGGYYDRLQNNFKATEYGYKAKFKYLNDQSLLTRRAELGFNITKQKAPMINIHSYYTHSNGKHLDFPKKDRLYGLGFRVLL